MTDIREFATWGVDEPLRVRKWVPLEEHEAEVAARDQTIKDLGFQLGIAEEGLANYAQENAHLHSTLTYRLRDLDDARAELHRIRNQSLEWALSCPHDCPECDRLYDAIRGEPQ